MFWILELAAGNVPLTMQEADKVFTAAGPENGSRIMERKSDNQLRFILNTIPAFPWSARPDASTDYFSQLYLDYAGLSADQGMDWGLMVAVHPDDLNGLTDYWQSVLAAGEAPNLSSTQSLTARRQNPSVVSGPCRGQLSRMHQSFLATRKIRPAAVM